MEIPRNKMARVKNVYGDFYDEIINEDAIPYSGIRGYQGNRSDRPDGKGRTLPHEIEKGLREIIKSRK